VVIRSYEPLHIFHVKCPDDLYSAIVHPRIEVKTSDARKILKQELPLRDVTRQCSNVAAFVAGLMNSDYELLRHSMHDLVAEPKRLQIIPGAVTAKKRAIDAGALGCSISGSGPSLFALCRGKAVAEVVAGAFSEAFAEAGLNSETYLTGMNSPGAYLV
jgi:homoserine kinase